METYRRYKGLILIVAISVAIFSCFITFMFVKSDYSYGRSIYHFGPVNETAIHAHDDPTQYIMLKLQSNSMLPTISQDNPVLAIKIDKEYISHIAEGDIIVFFRGDEKICHRVHSVLPEGLQTKGDANTATDSRLVRANDLYALVLCVFY